MAGRHTMLGRIADAALALACTAMRLSPAEAELARMAIASVAAAIGASRAMRWPVKPAALD